MFVLLGLKMVLEWMEHEHEDMDQESLQNPSSVNVLRSSGLLKFFCTSPMWANVRLLEFMIKYWDHDLGMFNLQGESLEITSEDIYFISGLSQRGAPVNLEGTGRGGDPLSVQNYIDIYCAPGTQKRGSCIPIIHICDLPLQVLTSTIVRVARSSSLHIPTQDQMRLAVDCMQRRGPYMISA